MNHYPKLIGGPLNRKKIMVPAGQRVVAFPYLKKPWEPEARHLRQALYSLRQVVMGDDHVEYFAYTHLSDEEAFKKFCHEIVKRICK